MIGGSAATARGAPARKGRAPHPDDCRELLAVLARERSEIARHERELNVKLAQAAETAHWAGLSISEIARLAVVSRQTVYVAMRRKRERNAAKRS